MTFSGHFFTTRVFIFHKTEVLTVILRYLMGLNLDWVKSYGLRCSKRPCECSVNSKKVATDKWPFFHQLYFHLSQNTVVQVTIRVGTLGYDLVPGICDTCQKTSQGSYIVSQKGISVEICGLATIVNFTPKKHKIGKMW